MPDIKTYYLFGSEAVQILLHNDLNTLVSRIEDNELEEFYETYCHCEDEPSKDLMAAFCGYTDYAILKKDDYDLLTSFKL